jgi:hypothetical protein
MNPDDWAESQNNQSYRRNPQTLIVWMLLPQHIPLNRMHPIAWSSIHRKFIENHRRCIRKQEKVGNFTSRIWRERKLGCSACSVSLHSWRQYACGHPPVRPRIPCKTLKIPRNPTNLYVLENYKSSCKETKQYKNNL